MKKASIITILLLYFNIYSLHSQSAWDIGYIFTESISDNDIGREVKLDFYSSDSLINLNVHPINFLKHQDSATLILCDKDTLEFVEKRKIFGDWGLFREQYLESEIYIKNINLRLRTAKIFLSEIREEFFWLRCLLKL